MRALLLALSLLPWALVASERWQFDGRVAVTGEPVAGVFQHLEGSGRKHIALSDGRVGVVWEDNRSGDPQVYLAIKAAGSSAFQAPRKVSDGEEAYEPAIAPLSAGALVLAWEQDGGVVVEVDHPERKLEPEQTRLRLAEQQAGQVSLATDGNRVVVVWREKSRAGWWLKVADLEVQANGALSLQGVRTVEKQAVPTPLLFPTVVIAGDLSYVAWEDRRAGHTRLMHSVASVAENGFEAPRYLNEFSSNRNQYDKGNGVTRVSAALVGTDEVLAAWMDKRRSNVGYGIFAAFGGSVGESFGPNEKVHGPKGDLDPHYNPAVAGNPQGDFVVVWDDFREGSSDVWLSSYNDDLAWSENFAPPVASGSGEQTHPSVAMDAQGNVHLVWLERASPDAPTRVWYALGRIKRD